MTALFCGRCDRREFVELANDARELAGRSGVAVLERRDFSADAAIRSVDFILLFRSYPNEFSVGAVERLRSLAPLAPIAMIAGTLCEGEDRTGDRFPGVRRFYANEWRERGRFELIRFFDASGATGLFAESPLTSETEYAATRRAEKSRSASACGTRALILSDDASLAPVLLNLFRSQGAEARAESWALFDATTESDFVPTRVVVDSSSAIDERFVSKVWTLRKSRPQAAIDVLTFAPEFFTAEFCEVSQRLSRFRVLSKPFDVASLLDERETSRR